MVSVCLGVTQGSVLAPFLFAAFMGSIDFSANHIECVKYADDITIIEGVPTNCISSIRLSTCENVINNAGLTLNIAKCKHLRICSTRSDARPVLDHSTGFTNVGSVKILGVTLGDRLKWNLHVSSILKTASQRLHTIRCMKYTVSNANLIQIYHSIITSLLLYATSALGCLPSTLLQKLEKFQRRSHKLICGDSCACHKFPDISHKRIMYASRLLEQSEKFSSHPLHHIVPSRLPFSRQLRMPLCETARRSASFLPWAVSLCNSQ